MPAVIFYLWLSAFFWVHFLWRGMDSIDDFKHRYEVELTKFSLVNQTLEIYVPKNIDRFINQNDIFDGFPLWSKIWEATAVLAFQLSKVPVKSEVKFLEIGAGMGVAGIYAATLGHDITITEYNDDAIHFARANAMQNGVDPTLIQKLDWSNPGVMGQFDYIIGSEVVFKETDIMSLHFLFQRYLKPGGTILLAEGMRKTSLAFVQKMEAYYQLKLKKQQIRSDKKNIPVVLIEMRAK